MCLSTVYDKSTDAGHALIRNVQALRIQGDKLIFTDLLERDYEYPAKLISADFVNGSIIIDLGT